MTTLFLDSDGVFADFDQHCFNSFGSYPDDLNDDDMWAMIHAKDDWWPTMPLMSGAHELWAAVRHLNPVVLTGCPKGNFEGSAAHKRVWWKNHFDQDAVITCLSKEKPLHMSAPGDILVDDLVRNIKRWEKAGGVGIVHRTNERTLEKLAALGLL